MWREHDNNATFSLGIENYQEELASIKNIIQKANKKWNEIEINEFKKGMDRKILLGVVFGFDKKKDFKNQIQFLIKNFELNYFYVRLFLRFIYKSIVIK